MDLLHTINCPQSQTANAQVEDSEFLRKYPWKLHSITSLLLSKLSQTRGSRADCIQWRNRQVITATILDSKRRKISAMKIILVKSKIFPCVLIPLPSTLTVVQNNQVHNFSMNKTSGRDYIGLWLSLKGHKYTSTSFDRYLIVCDLNYKVRYLILW